MLRSSPPHKRPMENQYSLIDDLASGLITSLDGVMSPTSLAIQERLGTNGFHMVSWWAMTSQDWTCPGCGRGKLDIARRNNQGEAMCHLHEHHDHMKEVLERKFNEMAIMKRVVVADDVCQDFAKRSASMIVAYEPTVVCADCNNADTLAKRLVSTPADFSFSPQEIRQFVKPEPNEIHEIDREIARAIWDGQRKTFELRMRIAERIAEIAANNEHWYQAAHYMTSAKAIEAHSSVLVKRFSSDVFVIPTLCGSRKNVQKKGASEWRLKKYPPCKAPPSVQEIDLMRNTSAAHRWARTHDAWSCEVCRRGKLETVTRNQTKKWVFHPGQSYFFGKSEGEVTRTICEECRHVAVMLGKELALRTGLDGTKFIRWITPDEMEQLIIPQPHARHNIDNVYAEQLIQTLSARIEEFG